METEEAELQGIKFVRCVFVMVIETDNENYCAFDYIKADCDAKIIWQEEEELQLVHHKKQQEG